MTKITEETYVDKTQWRDGPWKQEPDKLHFIDDETNMDCLIVRGPSGALCGYVAVEVGHPAFNANYNRVQVDIHGGLTYGAKCQEDGHICHVPQSGRSDEVYWLGFDCAHSGDFCPTYPVRLCFDHSAQYRNLAYVINEVQSLAKQLTERKPLREPYDWELED